MCAGNVSEVIDNLDVVCCRQSLDVSLLKDRLAVRQKHKRHTTALQRKIDASRFTQVKTAQYTRDYREHSATTDNRPINIKFVTQSKTELV